MYLDLFEIYLSLPSGPCFPGDSATFAHDVAVAVLMPLNKGNERHVSASNVSLGC